MICEEVERVRPLLGTTVAIRVSGLPRDVANQAIDRGFAAVAEVHRLMSFHSPESTLSHLNRDAWRGPVAVDRHTASVLGMCVEIAAASDGAFDPTVAPRLVADGNLPRPYGAPDADANASWRDIQIEAGGRVHFKRQMWIDLGGIAKGYAVDAAIAAMALPASVTAVVNAGGDLRAVGLLAEPVQLGVELANAVPIVVLEDGALASSTSSSKWGAETRAHFDGTSGRRTGLRSFAAVAAPHCMIADALTKPVLALGEQSAPLLRTFGATGYLYCARRGWRILGRS